MTPQERLEEIRKRKQEILSEMPVSKKRYVLTMDMYIYAENDEAALRLAQEIVQKEKDQYDNDAAIKTIHDVSSRGIGQKPQIYP